MATQNQRIEDYLNDKFQTTSDFTTIDALLSKLHEQQGLLRQQLEQARESLRDIDNDVLRRNEALQKRAQNFQNEQIDIDRRLKIITQSEVSDDAVQRFDDKMKKLRRIELAEGYMRTLVEIEQLGTHTKESLKNDPEQATRLCVQLSQLYDDLQSAQGPAEGAAPHLADLALEHKKSSTREVQGYLEHQLQQVLERIEWPTRVLEPTKSDVQEWSRYSGLLLQLQEPSLLLQARSTEPGDREPAVLLPLAVTINPLLLRFRYHFYGDRPTNRLDKPEYFFSHVLDLLDQHGAWVANLLQPVLDARIAVNQELENLYTDALSSFITALLPMVTQKCLSLLRQLTSRPPLLSHLMHELMSFDDTLRNSWAYSPYPGPLSTWKGLTHTILTKHDYFNPWLAVEKGFALSRYRNIREDATSNTIDYETTQTGQSKPTRGAIRVNDLLETITDRYRRLSSFSQKMRFLLDIQLSIFDDYHAHLDGVLQAYLVSSHRVGRLIQGQGQSAEDAMGTKGLEALIKIFGSAEYLERKMADWSDDVFFLELWEELQDRAAQHDGSTNGSVGKDLHIGEVAAKTSSTIAKTDGLLDSSENGGLFDETASSYRRLRERSEGEILRALDVSIKSALIPFTKTGIWKSLSTMSTSGTTDIAQLPPSASLDSLTQTLSALLGFLAQTLAPGPLRRTTRHITTTLQRELFALLTTNQFSAGGAAQFQRDVSAIEDTIDNATNLHGEARRHMRKVHDALTLLNLPIKSSTSASTSAPAPGVSRADSNDGHDTEIDADEWGFDDNDDETCDPTQRAEERDGDERDAPGLWQTEQAIMRSNESARQVLQDLGITELTETEARNVIRRRVEVGS